MRSDDNPYYPDVKLFLVLIPFISAFNYYLTYSDIRFNGHLLATFTIDTVQGYLAWMAVRKLILFLDKKMPYSGRPTRRIIIQVLSTLFLGLFIIIFLTELTSWIARGRPAALHFYTRDIFIISIWFFVINGFYVALHYIRELSSLNTKREKENQLRSQGLFVRSGRKEIQLDFINIAGFGVDGHYTVVYTIDEKRFYLDDSLDRITEKLPEKTFFRLNRQFILNRATIHGFKRQENGKILALLNQNSLLPGQISVSRTKAPFFKKWFHHS